MFSFINTDDFCQYWKNLDEMILSSPNYPKSYNADGVRCEWLISAQEGSIIALEFNDFDVSNLLDFVMKFAITFLFQVSYHLFLNFVSLYDGTCDQNKKLATLTEKMPNDDKWIISTSGHHMFVIFSKSRYYESLYPGFHAKIHHGKKLKYIKIVHLKI